MVQKFFSAKRSIIGAVLSYLDTVFIREPLKLLLRTDRLTNSKGHLIRQEDHARGMIDKQSPPSILFFGPLFAIRVRKTATNRGFVLINRNTISWLKVLPLEHTVFPIHQSTVIRMRRPAMLLPKHTSCAQRYDATCCLRFFCLQH